MRQAGLCRGYQPQIPEVRGVTRRIPGENGDACDHGMRPDEKVTQHPGTRATAAAVVQMRLPGEVERFAGDLSHIESGALDDPLQTADAAEIRSKLRIDHRVDQERPPHRPPIEPSTFPSSVNSNRTPSPVPSPR